MNKQELIGHVADRAGLSRNDASRAVETMLEVITSTLKRGDEVRLVGFGNFSVTRRKASTGRNPAHRRADADQGDFAAQVPPGQGAEGRGSIGICGCAADGWTGIGRSPNGAPTQGMGA